MKTRTSFAYADEKREFRTRLSQLTVTSWNSQPTFRNSPPPSNSSQPPSQNMIVPQGVHTSSNKRKQQWLGPDVSTQLERNFRGAQSVPKHPMPQNMCGEMFAIAHCMSVVSIRICCTRECPSGFVHDKHTNGTKRIVVLLSHSFVIRSHCLWLIQDGKTCIWNLKQSNDSMQQMLHNRGKQLPQQTI